MENPETPPPTAPPEPRPFKKWSECKKTLTKLPQPTTEADRGAVLVGIETSPQRLQIAFEFLFWSREPRFPSRLSWLVEPMISLLGSGDPEPDLEALQVASEAKAWIFREFHEVRNLADWGRFVTSGRHLWVLNAIFQASDNKHILVESLTALAECAEHCLNTDQTGKRKRSAISAEATSWIAKALKAKIPAKLGLPKTFLELLFAINSTAHLGEELQRETGGLQLRLKSTLEELATERTARHEVDGELAQTQHQLTETSAALAQCQEELREEKLHSTRQGGLNHVAKNETINQVMAQVRQGLIHRLDNISGFADRPNPNGEIIVELVEEIRNHLSGIEEALNR